MTSEVIDKPKVTKTYSIVYNVQSFTDSHKFYHVLVDKKARLPVSCSCPAYEFGNSKVCKHMKRVMESIEFEDYLDDTADAREKHNISSSSWKTDKYDF